MSFALPEPTSHLDPTEIAPGTFVVHEVQHAMGEPLSVFINSLVIQCEEPLIVDTGSLRNRRAWLEDTFSVVDPVSVKWVFISHEDVDHVGNLTEVMTTCPNAKLICSWAMMERYANAFAFPIERCRWMDDGDSFDAGDRRLTLVRPPIFDSPTTRGLFDVKTGVYWASDCFATPVPGGEGADRFALDVDDLDDEHWEQGMTMFAFHALAPWLRLVDQDRFAAYVGRLSDLPISTIASAHSPAIRAERIADVLSLTCKLPTAECPGAPDQAVLDLFLTASTSRSERGKAPPA